MEEPKKIKVTIEGVSPLLQNRFPEEDDGKTKIGKKVYNAEKDAIKALYQDDDGAIYHPSSHILGCLIKASVNYKFKGQKTYKDVVKSQVFIYPDKIPHKITKWEVDKQPVVIQRARIMRARPRFDKWALDFKIEILEPELLPVSTLKDMLEHAGKYVGIGDYRPRYGRFKVTKFEEIK